MVNKEEFEIIKMMSKEAKYKDLWIRVYDDKRKKDGLISISEVLDNILDIIVSSHKSSKENKK